MKRRLRTWTIQPHLRGRTSRLVGSAIVPAAAVGGLSTICCWRARDELDLRDQAAVDAFFATQRPEYVFLAAARVGGILANSTVRPNSCATTSRSRPMSSTRPGATARKKLLFLGSSCIYPKFAPQPIREEYLLTGPAGANQRMVRDRQDRRHQDGQAYRQQYGFRRSA